MNNENKPAWFESNNKDRDYAVMKFKVPEDYEPLVKPFKKYFKIQNVNIDKRTIEKTLLHSDTS